MSPLSLVALILAANSTTPPSTPTFPGGIVAWIVCNQRKKQQFGGWLLFYYWQLYSGAVVTVVVFITALQSYVPESYDDSGKYYLFIASTVPVLILFALQLAVATMLVSVRTWDVLRLLRALMIAELIASATALAIDANYFPESAGLDLLTVIPAALWLAYFFRSRRVVHVFKAHDWEIAVNTFYPPAATRIT